ncbi:hypothetical protein [Sulfuricurvum sp.]|uniref:hypothetical protein n=1 Tax=Sulfuricurvum sp. TaxID=2025608 RepID=UPI002627BA97|nr:hypothetical protein [Sulfuricurvum sp.]MDD3595474.1 hypothetical protein [Sulfuricurvum sp.]MDD4883390.1 hypothetical protein [Sulfuricurvum sp.]
MQRSIPYQNIISKLLLIALFIGYISLSSIYLLLPPLLAVLFFAYHDALSKHDLFGLSIVSVMLLVFEAEKGFWFGSTIIFFTLLSRYVIPKLEQVIQCRICMAAIFVLLAYPGYWIYVWIVDQVLLFQLPVLDWHIALYMIVEFLVIAALV